MAKSRAATRTNEFSFATADIRSLAAKLGDEIGQSYVSYRIAHGLELEHAHCLERAQAQRPQDLRWEDLNDIATASPERAVETWQRLYDTARNELSSGHRAASALEHTFTKPLDRALFLALLDSLVQDWQPHGAVEKTLLENLAQAYTMREMAIKTMIQRQNEGETHDRREYEAEWSKNKDQHMKWGSWMRPRVSVQEAVDIAKSDVDRWDRLATRTLRQLQNLRRYNVVINNQGQINIGDKQVNIERRNQTNSVTD